MHASGLLACGALLEGCSSAPPKSPRFDSLLLVTIDTLRADHVSCYGPSPVRTPSLDGLAHRGAIVRRAWATVPLTTASHASILTGLYPPAHGVRDNSRFRLPEGVLTLALRLGRSGRRTAAFVSSYTTSSLFGFDKGFETFNDDLGHTPDGSRRQQRPGDETARLASAWLEGHAAEPFFVWVHLFDPHTPYEPPPEYLRDHPGDPYSGEVAFADAQLGRVLEALGRTGAARRTAVAVLADHGEGLGDHGEADHGYLLYETTLRIPFLLVAEGRIAPGTELAGPASTVDLVPTVLDLLGLPVPEDLEGRSLVGTDAARDRSLYAETLYPLDEFGWSPLYATRRGDLKLIEAPQRELYDLASDPAERSNIAGARPADAGSLSDGLRVLMRGLADAGGKARAAANQPDVGPEQVAKLESLGYAGGGGGAGPEAQAFPPVGGRNPREAMGDVKRLWEAQFMLLSKKPREAIPILESLAKGDPDNPKVQIKLGQALADAGRDDEAANVYEGLIRRRPTFYYAYRAFSDFLEERKRPKEMLALWQRAPAALRGLVGIEIVTARAERTAGMPAQAASRLEAYLRARPGDVEGWTELGRARSDLGDKEKSLEAYQRALALHPTERTAIEGAVNLLVKSGRREDAAGLVRDLLRRAPGDPLLLKAQAWIEKSAGRPASARPQPPAGR
jgi:arylsulfatase A-like enzyme/Flp pilus assembly protein TadD